MILRALPFDRIKIDGSFVKSVTTDKEAATIVNAIINLARSLDLPTTAECVETPASAKVIKAAGCATGQGWHYGGPMSAEEAEAMLVTEAAAAEGPHLVGRKRAI
jgi:EAL domain-containing protein (putative c-di-GMP-specific phosphodiesterase class I)